MAATKPHPTLGVAARPKEIKNTLLMALPILMALADKYLTHENKTISKHIKGWGRSPTREGKNYLPSAVIFMVYFVAPFVV